MELKDYIKPDQNGHTPLHGAAWKGQLDQVMAALEASGEKLTLDHFLIKDNDDRTPLHGAAENGHLDQVFLPSYWTGRLSEMMKLWDQVPPEYKEDLDFNKLRDEAIMQSVQSAPKLNLEALSEAVRAGGAKAAADPLVAETTLTR